MSEPHECPVCHGKGEVPPFNSGRMSVGCVRRYNLCHACNGTGIVWSPEEDALVVQPVEYGTYASRFLKG